MLNWSNRFFGNGLDTTVLPPENDLVRLAVNGNLRQLPFDSTLAGRFTYSKLTNEVPMLPSMLSTGGVTAPTNPSSSQFDGELEKMTLGLAFNSRPTQALDTKVYYNWFKEDNSSTHMSFVPGTGSPAARHPLMQQRPTARTNSSSTRSTRLAPRRATA